MNWSKLQGDRNLDEMFSPGIFAALTHHGKHILRSEDLLVCFSGLKTGSGFKVQHENSDFKYSFS